MNWPWQFWRRNKRSRVLALVRSLDDKPAGVPTVLQLTHVRNLMVRALEHLNDADSISNAFASVDEATRYLVGQIARYRDVTCSGATTVELLMSVNQGMWLNAKTRRLIARVERFVEAPGSSVEDSRWTMTRKVNSLYRALQHFYNVAPDGPRADTIHARFVRASFLTYPIIGVILVPLVIQLTGSYFNVLLDRLFSSTQATVGAKEVPPSGPNPELAKAQAEAGALLMRSVTKMPRQEQIPFLQQRSKRLREIAAAIQNLQSVGYTNYYLAVALHDDGLVSLLQGIDALITAHNALNRHPRQADGALYTAVNGQFLAAQHDFAESVRALDAVASLVKMSNTPPQHTLFVRASQLFNEVQELMDTKCEVCAESGSPMRLFTGDQVELVRGLAQTALREGPSS